MAQVAPGIARFELKMRVPDNIIENVFHVRKTSLGLWTEAELDAAKAAFVTWFTTYYSTRLSDQLGLFEIVATDLTSLFGIRKVYGVSPALLGGLTGEYLPANVTFALKASIAKRGRGTSGRIFWASIVDSQIVNQQLDSTEAGLFIGIMGQLITAMAALAGMDGLVVPHFMVGGAHPPSVTADKVVSYSYSDLWLDSQRDRLPAHKKHKKPTP
jgi:hypothetical protein